MKISPNAPCPCVSKRKYKQCCAVFHRGKPAPTPEALMRSRYSAYALHNSSYIIKTTHPDNPAYRPHNEAAWRADIETFCRTTRFANLDLLLTKGGNTPDEGWVTFKASLFQGEQDISYIEQSFFQCHEGLWKYVSGEKR